MIYDEDELCSVCYLWCVTLESLNDKYAYISQLCFDWFSWGGINSIGIMSDILDLTLVVLEVAVQLTTFGEFLSKLMI